MVTRLAVVPGSNTAKAVIMGASFVTGVVLGSVSKWKPSWGMPMTLGIGAIGVAGAFLLDGMLANMSEGLANAALATLGTSVPYYMAKSSGSTSARMIPAAAPRYLPQGNAAARVGLSPMFDTIQQA